MLHVSEVELPSMKQNLMQILCSLELFSSKYCETYCTCLH